MSNTNLKSIIESLLFVSHKPLSLNEFAKITGGKKEEIKEIIIDLSQEYKAQNRGIIILENNNKYQLASNPDNAKAIKAFFKKEVSDEMTPASLETLSIVAYRGPINRQELEEIRGVNCSIILRNLLIKGLIEKKDQENEIYDITLEFMRRVGISKKQDLPEFEGLNGNVPLGEFIDQDQV
ncbi:MAG TPA: SMC-Scp complex subunit ScpB [Patescibacteria group bacterium]|nr:SMC-Scp complex subunit ScpB [Patescibacteria group bacterium]